MNYAKGMPEADISLSFRAAPPIFSIMSKWVPYFYIIVLQKIVAKESEVHVVKRFVKA